ncbi:MAG: hypothetical protein C4527_17765 [Candidatus Omnitrophota bacterium]|jgi:hypothetical protein|nr:MAG: hypothetical protein C4527_17765 [Candidatus Omnitrophota bacterium]
MTTIWSEIITQLPGLYLQDQHPPGSGIAVSVEKHENGGWILHYAKEKTDSLQHGAEGPFDAAYLYEKLKFLYRDIGYTPQLRDEELKALHLPDSQEVYTERVFAHLPGRLIGSQRIAESGMDWVVNYSVGKNADHTYTLYSCSARGDDDFLAEPEIEELGTFALHDLLEELRIYGFRPDDYAGLCEIEASSWQEILRALPGRRVENQRPEEDRCAVSLVAHNRECWTLFYAVPIADNRYRLNELATLSAKDVYKKVYDLTGCLLSVNDRKKVQLPELIDIYGETLSKKMKGDYIGGVPSVNMSKRYNETYVTVQNNKDDSRLFYFTSAEELITLGRTGRKINVHKLGPYKDVDLGKFIVDIEPHVDLLELILKLDESKIEGIRELSKRLKKITNLD